MTNDLDDILLSADCPNCGATVNFPYKQLRLYGAAGCRCGALLTLLADTPIAAEQNLIDEANLPVAEND